MQHGQHTKFLNRGTVLQFPTAQKNRETSFSWEPLRPAALFPQLPGESLGAVKGYTVRNRSLFSGYLRIMTPLRI